MSDLEHMRKIVEAYPEADLEAAQRGDPTELAEKVRSGQDLSEGEREFVARLVEERATKSGERRSAIELTVAVMAADAERRGIPREAMVEEACSKLNLSRSRVFDLLRSSRENSHAMQWAEFVRNSEI